MENFKTRWTHTLPRSRFVRQNITFHTEKFLSVNAIVYIYIYVDIKREKYYFYTLSLKAKNIYTIF